MTRLVLLLLVLAALTACGNKGPLVMPGPAAAPAPVVEPAPIDPAQPPVGTESDSEPEPPVPG